MYLVSLSSFISSLRVRHSLFLPHDHASLRQVTGEFSTEATCKSRRWSFVVGECRLVRNLENRIDTVRANRSSPSAAQRFTRRSPLAFTSSRLRTSITSVSLAECACHGFETRGIRTINAQESSGHHLLLLLLLVVVSREWAVTTCLSALVSPVQVNAHGDLCPHVKRTATSKEMNCLER